MTTDGKHEGASQEDEGDDALWRLLARGPRPGPVSPYFARRVLREVALLGEGRAPTSNWLWRLWQAARRAPGVACACVLVAAALTAVGGLKLSSNHWPSTVGPAGPVAVARSEAALTSEVAVADNVLPAAMPENEPVPQPTVALASEPVVTAQDVEVIADLDNVLSREESRLWTEDDTARF